MSCKNINIECNVDTRDSTGNSSEMLPRIGLESETMSNALIICAHSSEISSVELVSMLIRVDMPEICVLVVLTE